MTRPRVVVAGLGDAGLLVAIHLSRHVDVVGISTRPGLLSGQELGMRLSRPAEWVRDYWTAFDRYTKLDRVRTVHGEIIGLDADARTVAVRLADGSTSTEPYDVLVVATGVSNGFWRRPQVQSAEEVDAALQRDHERVAAASSVVVVGGGAAAVSAAYNIAATWPDKTVDLYFPGDRALPLHHSAVWTTLERRLRERGVGLHPGHRAVVPDGFWCDEITAGPVSFGTGQPDAEGDAVLWAIGRVRPNTGWMPAGLLDDDGFVRVDRHLRSPSRPEVFAIGDVAASDPLRNSARSRADHLLAHNVRATFSGGRMKVFRPRRLRWGSVVGTQDNGLEVFAPNGRSFTLRPWSALQPWVVRRAIYKGVRPPS